MKDKTALIVIGILGLLGIICVSLVLGFVAFFGYFRVPSIEPPQLITPTTKPRKCYISGCSREICSSRSDIASTCEYTEEYSCYAKPFAECKVQSDGMCGWTQNQELKQCILDSRNLLNLQD